MRQSKIFDSTLRTCCGTRYQLMNFGVYFRRRSITRGRVVVVWEVVSPRFFVAAGLESTEPESAESDGNFPPRHCPVSTALLWE